MLWSEGTLPAILAVQVKIVSPYSSSMLLSCSAATTQAHFLRAFHHPSHLLEGLLQFGIDNIATRAEMLDTVALCRTHSSFT